MPKFMYICPKCHKQVKDLKGHTARLHSGTPPEEKPRTRTLELTGTPPEKKPRTRTLELKVEKPEKKTGTSVPQGYHCIDCGHTLNQGQTPCPNCRATLDWGQL